MRKRASIFSKRRRTRGLHRAGGSPQLKNESISLGNAYVLDSSSLLWPQWKQQNISLTHTSVDNTVNLLGKTFQIDKLRFYSEDNTLIPDGIRDNNSHKVPMKSRTANWRYRVDFLDADNQVNSIQFKHNPRVTLNGIMERTPPFPKICLMQGMLKIKYRIGDFTKPPSGVAGGLGTWTTKNCVLYHTNRNRELYKLVFEYEWNSKISRITLQEDRQNLGCMYPIDDRTNWQKSNRFDLYWEENKHNLCLQAHDSHQKNAWMSAFKEVGLCSSASGHPRIRILNAENDELLQNDTIESYERLFGPLKNAGDNI